MSWRLTDKRFLKGFWKLNGNARDLSGNGNDLTWAGTEKYTEGPYGRSVADFDGSSNVSTNALSAAMASGAISVTAKTDRLSNGSDAIVESDFSGSRIGLVYDTGTTSPRFLFRGQNAAGVDVGFGYAHFVMAWSGTTVNYYQDGKYIGFDTFTGTPSLAGFSIGSRYDGAADLLGQCFNARLYNANLTYDEVIQLNRLDRRV